ncbi:MAG: BatA domain-containing protein, partial [Alphaproteobacteria bacterium]
MLTMGALAFAAPWALLGLVALPIIWWLLRVTPPAPQRQQNPAIRFLLNFLVETPARTPLWLILLRMGLAALAILALAQPLLNPSGQLQGSGPLVLVVDDGWAAARHWRARQAAMVE